MLNPLDVADLERGRVENPRVRATALDAFVLETPDLAAAERFYLGFGLTVASREEGTLHLRAAGPTPWVLKLVAGPQAHLKAVVVRVETEAELRALAASPGASAVESSSEPGGGLRVHLRSPGGTGFIAVQGVRDVAPLPSRVPEQAVHTPGTPLRLEAAPCAVLKLGHVVLDTRLPRATLLWLVRTFGMIVSDYQSLEGEPHTPVTAFLRFDRGATATDHHSLALTMNAREQFGHAAFEVRGLDELAMGGEWLARGGHTRAWGIGRHLIGSQLFDYWRAPDGAIVEHYAEGERCDASAPTHHLPFQGSSLVQWGPRLPRGFGMPPLSLGVLAEAVGPLLRGQEASLPRLARMIRALSR